MVEAKRRRSRLRGPTCEIVYVDERRVASAREGLPEERALGDIAELFGALSDRTRLRLLYALAREELCVCDLAQVAGRSIPAVSHQLALLRRLGLVAYRNEGKLSYHRLDSDAVRELLRDAGRRKTRGSRS
jgi:DNA-binding transcriptional ArsR family regulator